MVKRIVAGKRSGGGHLTYAGGQIPLKEDTESERQKLKRQVECKFLQGVGMSGVRCSTLLAE